MTDPDLEDRLARYGDALQEAIAVPRSAPVYPATGSLPARPRVNLPIILAAAVMFVVAGFAVRALLVGPGGETTTMSAEPEDSELLGGADADPEPEDSEQLDGAGADPELIEIQATIDAAVETCRVTILDTDAEYFAAGPTFPTDLVNPNTLLIDPNLDEGEVVTIVLPEESDLVVVFFQGERSSATCTVNRTNEMQASSHGATAIEPGVDAAIVTSWSGTSASASIGPVDLLVQGRVGRAVVGVTLMEGPREIPGVIKDGRFVVYATVSTAPEELGALLLSWSGKDGSAGHGTLEELSDGYVLQQCTSDALCVERRIAQLIEQLTQHPDRTGQTAILADGIVTDQELATARESFVECAADTTQIRQPDDTIRYTEPPTDTERQAVETCWTHHAREVAEARDLQDRADRVHEENGAN